MSIITYPLDNIDYSAEDAALFHCTRNSGIYAQDDFSISVTGADNSITIGPGLAWLRVSKFRGLAAAMKTETTLDLGLADSTYPRIDRVVLRYDANANETTLAVKHGTAQASPIPPERSTTESLYELHLIQIYRRPGAAAITAADVTDLRMNEGDCGLMADSVTHVDLSALESQFRSSLNDLLAVYNAWFQDIRDILSEDAAGNLLGSIEALEATVWEKIYPVGSVYVGSTAQSPAEIFGGTWECFRKEAGFLSLYETQDSSPKTLFSNKKCSDYSIYAQRVGNSLWVRCNLTSAAKATDSEVVFGTINYSALGITGTQLIHYVTAYSDKANSSMFMTVSSSGEIKSVDAVPNDLAKGDLLKFEFTQIVGSDFWAEEAIEKWYWRRLADPDEGEVTA